MNQTSFLLAVLLSGAFLLSACGDDGGTGTLEVEIWGEEYIEQGIPASEFADGWSVTYDAFLVNVGEIQAAGNDLAGYGIVDLTRSGPFALHSVSAPSGGVGSADYTIAPADSNSVNVNADQAAADEMVAAGYAVYVAGSATDGSDTVTFEWGFDHTTVYADCHATGNIPKNGTGTVQLTIHGDHLFYDSLVEAEPSLRFQALADADADQDGVVTLAELEAVSGNAFLALDHYDVEPGSGIDNLRAYVTYLVSTLGHIDGEGHCH